jgi:hypothetical protein
MELKEQPPAATLARRLGDTAHVSGLAIRLARLSGAGDRLPEWLLRTAVERGAKHYQRDFDPSLPPDNPTITDEEIGVALCLGQHPYHLDNLRAAAQFLTSPRVDAARLCRLAVRERCEPVLVHIAAVAERFAAALEPWAYLRQHLPPRPVPGTDALPHWTRLVSHTGLTAQGGPPKTDWLRRVTVFRPATLDLILTKMARGDANDLADIAFLLTRESPTADQLRAAFARARVPDVPEIQALFRAAQPKVLALVKP